MSDWVYFCEKETITGLVVGYNKKNGIMCAVPDCHPPAKLNQNSSVSSLSCTICNKKFTHEVVKAAIGCWAVEWILRNEDYSAAGIAQWIQGWTGIEAGNIDVVLKPGGGE